MHGTLAFCAIFMHTCMWWVSRVLANDSWVIVVNSLVGGRQEKDQLHSTSCGSGWRNSSVVEYFPFTCKALGKIQSNTVWGCRGSSKSQAFDNIWFTVGCRCVLWKLASHNPNSGGGGEFRAHASGRQRSTLCTFVNGSSLYFWDRASH